MCVEGACTIACIVRSFFDTHTFDAHTFDAHTKDSKTQCYTDIGVCFVDTDIGVCFVDTDIGV